MSHDYTELTGELSNALRDIRRAIPEVTNGFSAMARAATAEGVLDAKTKELLAMGIAVAVRCQGCLGFHAQTLVKLGTTREEFMEMLGMAVYMGGGPSLMTAAEAWMAFEEFQAKQNARTA